LTPDRLRQSEIAMDREHLNTLLESLHGELEQGPPLDDSTRELLLTVLTDIRDVLERSPAEVPTEPDTVAGRLRETTWHVEEAHPSLTSSIKSFVEAWSRTFQ
jgi:hypothetical protein